MHNIPDMRLVFAWIGTLLGEFIGEIDSLIYALAIFMIVDYLTGVLCGLVNGRLSSRIGFKGICRKVMILCLVGMANVLDQYILQTGSVLRTTVIFFYLSNEGISIIENSIALGVPIPNKMYKMLNDLKNN
ncbi:holin family protein [Anaerovibrio slackiae]|uniref:phage holin family protein n=1 Tax=Anaerovibrio slackiae TaxID=2652309 RepID=UPI0038708248